MPEVVHPDTLTPELDLIRREADRIPESLRSVLTQERPIDIRPVDPIDPQRAEKREPIRRAWFRAVGRLPDEPWVHQAVLAYASDYGLLVTALQPHGIAYRTRGLQLASLDHSLWMHRPFRADEWLLYSTDSPVTGRARGFVRGTIHSQSGELVASTAQEGLIRLRKTDRE
jgi:acyl-CoA thioesterase-2